MVEYDGGPSLENFVNWLALHSEAYKEARPEDAKLRKEEYEKALE